MNDKSLSRFLSLILRHKPETIGLELDPNGWIDIDTLLSALNAAGKSVTREDLARVVENNDKQRFIIQDGRIRANQGHSVSVDLGLTETAPPQTLYHGTATRFLDRIRAEGLKKMNRQHVHLSPDKVAASKVGVRHGKLVVLKVAAEQMHSDGFAFYRSANGVWLVDSVPASYLEEWCVHPLTNP